MSRSGIVPISHTQDTAGPMARTVADAAALLNVLVGADPADGATAASRGKVAADYTSFLDANGLKGARIGVARAKFFGYSPETDELAEEAIKDLRRLGAVIVDPADYAPVLDVDTNPRNPVIGDRSIGPDPAHDARRLGRPGAIQLLHQPPELLECRLHRCRLLHIHAGGAEQV